MLYYLFLASLLSLLILSIPFIIYAGWMSMELARQKKNSEL